MVGESLARQFAQKQDLTLQKKVIVAEFTISDCNSKRATIGVVIVNTVIDRFNKHCLSNSIGVKLNSSKPARRPDNDRAQT